MANTSAQGLRQGIIRASTGTTLTTDGDWMSRFTALGLSLDGGFNGRLLLYINNRLGQSYTSLPQAMAAFAVANNATNFGAIITFTA